jgi:hypothetical protein
MQRLTPMVNVGCFQGVTPSILKSILDYKSHLISDAEIRITDFDALRNSLTDCETKPIEYDEKEEKDNKDNNKEDEQRNKTMDLSSPIITEELGINQ